jgi:peptide/nickel transport system substrate-binding protein
MMEGWTGDNGDPDNFLGEMWSYKNFPVVDWSRYNNPAVESLLSQALVEADPAKRTPLYEQVQKIILDDAPWIFLNSTLQIRAIRNNVKGYQLNPTQMFFGMENVSVE